ncbi:hypothetical protein [Prosthecobacter sp.]|uniref:hypothetical protein n=1 Tax=Prosthecobacter sp. TaxID=1965333 RepID=UPI002489DED4|nr:hypothetical protein [Prosthecobacter sp.]MDI1312445.1 hypothetical protein [Prosthecobacter sp.]
MTDSSSTPRRHGFRCSIGDALILAAGLGLSCWLHALDFPLAWIVPAALGHFFLFCNVFLVWRRWELLWASAFVLNVAAHLALGSLDWLSPLLFQLPITVLVIIWQIRSPWYHGILAEQLNPRLKEYLAGRQ